MVAELCLDPFRSAEPELDTMWFEAPSRRSSRPPVSQTMRIREARPSLPPPPPIDDPLADEWFR